MAPPAAAKERHKSPGETHSRQPVCWFSSSERRAGQQSTRRPATPAGQPATVSVITHSASQGRRRVGAASPSVQHGVLGGSCRAPQPYLSSLCPDAGQPLLETKFHLPLFAPSDYTPALLPPLQAPSPRPCRLGGPLGSLLGACGGRTRPPSPGQLADCSRSPQ